MKLPDDSIGISDILQWRDCPARFALGMRRHTEGSYPGETDWTNAYGSTVHDAIHLVEGGMTPADAVTEVWKSYGGHLDPEDLELLNEDLARFSNSTPLGMELIASEMEARVPLFAHEGRQIYFRFRIDALYRRIEDKTVFYMRDYKSSKWRKSQAEVDTDLQMWAYNWAIHELFPEARALLQTYDQLRFGRLRVASKSADQRRQMKAWLIETARALLGDEELKPKQNQWCPYCPLVATCSETTRATDTWKARLAALAPQTKEGRKLVIDFHWQGAEMETMIRDVLPRMIESRKHIEAAEKELKRLIEELPSERRAELGWRLADRRTKVLDAEGLEALHEALGPLFYEVASLSRSAVESAVGKPKKGEPLPEPLRVLAERELEKVSTTLVLPA